MRPNLDDFVFAMALVWAGVSLGGNLIAAPAKFTVDALELPVALQVGRAQFHWIGYAEFVLAGMVSVAAYMSKSTKPKMFLAAVLAFAVQRTVLMPRLSERTDMIASGQLVSESNLHMFFICLELLKIVTLVAIAWWMLSSHDRHSYDLGVIK